MIRRWIGVAVAILLAASPLFGQQVVLDLNRSARSGLDTALDQIAAGDVDEGLDFIDQIIAASGDDLCRVAPGSFTTVRRLCHAALMRLPASALRRHRERVDARANQWLRRGLGGEPDQLHRLLWEYPASTAAGRALHHLGMEAWHSNQPGVAYEYWRRLIPAEDAGAETTDPRYPGSEPAAPTNAAGLILCRLAMGDAEMARNELQAFRRAFPGAVGTIAGTNGPLVELLEARLTDFDARTATRHSWRWTAQWTRELKTAPPATSDRPRTRILPTVTSVPLMSGDGLFVATRASLLGFSADTGLNMWSGEKDVTLFAGQDQGLSGPHAGVPRFHPTATEDRLLFRSGSPITSRNTRDLLNAVTSNTVTCMDIGRRQGKLLWQVNATDLAVEGAFEGTPVPSGDRCFGILRTSPPTSSLVAVCLSVEDGQVLWKKQLCAGLDEPGEQENRITSLSPVVTRDHVIFPTNNGAVIALDHDGRTIWAHTYDRVGHDHPEHEAGCTLLARHGTLFIAPRDSQSVMAVREYTGALLWQRQLPDRIRHVTGVSGGTVIVSGRSPWGLAAATGLVRWGGPRTEPERFGFGRGAVLGNRLLFPSRDSIEVRDCQTGRPLLPPIPVPGGNLIASRHQLVIARDDTITVLSAADR